VRPAQTIGRKRRRRLTNGVEEEAEWLGQVCQAPSQVQAAGQAAHDAAANADAMAAAADASAGVFVGTPGLSTGGAFAPAKPGDVLTLYATGLGLTNPSFAAGQLPSAASSIAGDIQVTIGTTTLAKTDVLYAGVTPSTAGLYQVNIHLPISIPNGDQPVQMTISGTPSPSGGYITVKQ